MAGLKHREQSGGKERGGELSQILLQQAGYVMNAGGI